MTGFGPEHQSGLVGVVCCGFSDPTTLAEPRKSVTFQTRTNVQTAAAALGPTQRMTCKGDARSQLGRRGNEVTAVSE